MHKMKSNKSNDKKAGRLIGFFVAGYPDEDSFLEILSESEIVVLIFLRLAFPVKTHMQMVRSLKMRILGSIQI